LAKVFPALREQVNKNANDTASAMTVLYGELKKLNEERAKIEEIKIDTASTEREKNIARINSRLFTQEAAYNSLVKSISQYDLGIENIVKITDSAFGSKGIIKNMNDVKVYLSTIKEGSNEFNLLKKSIDELEQSGDWTTVFNFNDLLKAISLIGQTKIELKELQRTGKDKVSFDIK
jgi:uncharacterized protein with von Willebrand factor type A (vWA) domain